MSCTNTCESNEIKYKGDGSQVLFTFPFTYINENDVKASLWDETALRWVNTTEWTFANATTIRFKSPPPAALYTDTYQFNVKISRCTSINPLAASFYPGAAIRAQDLNENFEQLQLAIQEGRCQVPSWLFDYLSDFYWNLSATTLIDDDWESEADDLHIPSTGAVDKYVDTAIQKDYNVRSVTELEQLLTGGAGEIDDAHYFTTAAARARHDVYHQDKKPAYKTYEQPAKGWFDTATLEDYNWDSNAGAWVDMQNAGPAGPEGPPGKPGVGGSTLTFRAPLKETAGVVSIDLQTINKFP